MREVVRRQRMARLPPSPTTVLVLFSSDTPHGCPTEMDVIVNTTGIALIAAIVWWFWLARPVARRFSSAQPIEVVVADGSYSPARIELPTGKPTTLRFVRKDPSPCAEQVVFRDLNVSADLVLDEPVEVTITLPAPGEYTFTCQMQMYRGTLVGV